MLRHHGDGHEKGMEREQRINEDKCSADSNVNTSRRHYIPYLIELYTPTLIPAQSVQVFQLWNGAGGKMGCGLIS